MLTKSLRQDLPPASGLVFVSILTWSSLLSTAPQVLNTDFPAQQAENEAKASSSVSIDESQPTTNIQIRLADGGRLVQKFNHSHRYLMLSGRPYFRRVPKIPTKGGSRGLFFLLTSAGTPCLSERRQWNGKHASLKPLAPTSIKWGQWLLSWPTVVLIPFL